MPNYGYTAVRLWHVMYHVALALFLNLIISLAMKTFNLKSIYKFEIETGQNVFFKLLEKHSYMYLVETFEFANVH